ncbi:MAG: hypothetical protein U1F43_08535 [Myxococcota bacterium]
MNRIAAAASLLLLASACTETAATSDDDAAITTACALTCDDGQICTEDRCSAETGECIHVPRDANNACRLDSHCDDGDPCTTDSCGHDPECPSLQRCQHELIQNCRSCTAFNPSCEDNNPCTTDTCGADQLCRYTTEPTCNPRCRMWGQDFYQPSNAFEGQVSIYGTATARGGASCLNACDCKNDLVLSDFSGGSVMALSGLAETWSCDIANTCSASTTVACAPLEYQREYVVYGQASASDPTVAADAAIPAPPREDAGARADVGSPFPPQTASYLTVEGWCLAMTTAGVIGRYDGSLLLDDAAAPVTFQAEILNDNFRGAIIRVTGGAPRVPDQEVSYDVFNTGYQLTTFLQLSDRGVVANLFPGPDRLEGPVIDPNLASGEKPSPDVPVPPPPGPTGGRIGTLTLVLKGH